MFKNSKVIINFIFAVIQILLIIIESLFIKLNFSNLDLGVNIILTAISVIATIIFAYLIFIKERYSYYNQVIKGEVSNLISVFILFIVGFIITLIDNIFISQMIYIVYALGYIIVFVFIMCKKMCTNEITLLIKKMVDNVDKSIEKLNEDEKKDLKLLLTKFNTTYKFEYEKRNIIACTKIINNYSKFMEKALIERNNKIINNVDKYDDLFKLLIFFYGALIIKEKNDFSNKINMLILRKYSKFINELVKCEASKAIDIALENLINIYKENEIYLDMDEAVEQLYFLICDIYKNNNISEFKKINKRIIGLLRFYSISSNDFRVKNLIFKYFSSLLVDLITEKNEFYDVVIKDLKFILMNNSIPKDTLYIISCLSSIVGSKIYDNSVVKHDIYNLVFEIIEYNSFALNENFVQWLIMYINNDNIPIYEDQIKIRTLICMRLIETNKEIPFLLIPNFLDKAQENVNNDEYNYKCINTFKELLNKCFENKKIESLRYICENINSILNVYQKQNQKEQEMWLKVYFSLLMDSLFVQDSTMIESVMYYFRKSIFTLDKEKKISKQTAKFIINSMQILSDKYIIQNEKVTIMILELFKEFLDIENNFNFVYIHDEIQRYIYQQIYYIAVSAIERNSENVIKEISNLIGWKIKEKIEKNSSVYANLCIDYAINIYELCHINCINEQTIVFVGTLFIIIGALCETNVYYNSYKKRIKSKIAKEKYMEFLSRSKKLRESAIEEWKNILGNAPQDKFDKFWDYLYTVKQ